VTSKDCIIENGRRQLEGRKPTVCWTGDSVDWSDCSLLEAVMLVNDGVKWQWITGFSGWYWAWVWKDERM